jgi:hypothetical protein
MRDDLIIQQAKAAIETERRRPPRERWDDLVRRGVIDAEGRLLLPSLCGPETPNEDSESETPNDG